VVNLEIITISQKYNFAQFEFAGEWANFVYVLQIQSRDTLKLIFVLSYSNYTCKNKNALKRKYERFRRIVKIE
jgi:hypothetical protein